MTLKASDQPVVTRFAPSPTGALHIGGARTALYAWAYARHHAGKFILRFEDTDRLRSSRHSEQSIIEDLRWLGLDWDQGPVRQSERLDYYNPLIDQLLESGHAYEEVPDVGEQTSSSSAPHAPAIRFRMDREVSFHDAVYGSVTWPADSLEDFVIRKSAAGDFYPTFHLAVVADDAAMGVSHVIRGQEHLANTAKHAALYDALGFDRPVWAHTPSIMNVDGSKMSKRDKAKLARREAKQAQLESSPTAEVDAQRFKGFLNNDNDDLGIAQAIAKHLDLALPEIDTADFRRSGYLPEVLCNYIALLGWNPGEDLERFDLAFFAEHFDFARVGKANARFDHEKLAAFNQQTLGQLPTETFEAKLRDYLRAYHPAFIEALGPEHLPTFAAMYQPRSRTLEDPVRAGAFFINPPSAYEPKAVKKQLQRKEGEGLNTLRAFAEYLARADIADAHWTAPIIQRTLETFVEQNQLKNLGSIAQPLRVALTGTAVSPPIDQTLALLGQPQTRHRIQRCLEQLG